MNALTIAGTGIRTDAAGRYCLNDLHRASGGEERHRPSRWTENQQTRELITAVEAKAGIPALVSRHGGNAPGTYVVKPLVYAYAMWISPAFHLAVIDAYDAIVTGQAQTRDRSEALAAQVAALFAEQNRLLALLLDATPAQPRQVTDDPATPVWATVAALTAAGCRVNHARAANRLALNLPELRALAQTHGQPLPGRLALYRLLLRSPRWLASNRAVNSAVDGRVRKCWLFTA